MEGSPRRLIWIVVYTQLREFKRNFMIRNYANCSEVTTEQLKYSII